MAETAEPDPAEARAALADELLDLLPPGHPVIRVLSTRPMLSDGAGYSARSRLPAAADGLTMPVTIYLSEEDIHAEVVAAVERLLATAGLWIVERDVPIIGSWFQRMVAAFRAAAQSPAGQEAIWTAEHAVEARLVIAQDAELTNRLLQSVPPLIGSLQPTKDAVIRVGALLIVKVDWVVSVFQLSAAQQARLDHHPQFATLPGEIIAQLSLGAEDKVDVPGPSRGMAPSLPDATTRPGPESANFSKWSASH